MASGVERLRGMSPVVVVVVVVWLLCVFVFLLLWIDAPPKKKTSIIWMLAGEEFFGFQLIGCSHVSNSD